MVAVFGSVIVMLPPWCHFVFRMLGTAGHMVIWAVKWSGQSGGLGRQRVKQRLVKALPWILAEAGGGNASGAAFFLETSMSCGACSMHGPLGRKHVVYRDQMMVAFCMILLLQASFLEWSLADGTSQCVRMWEVVAVAAGG